MVAAPPSISSNSVLSYFKDHLLVSGFRGSVYQLSHFTHFCLHHLFKGREIQGTMEARGYGNCDDIQIKLSEKIKVYQVKFFKNPIDLQDFLKKPKKETTTGKMHIGKFFDGWLSLQDAKQGREVIPYLLTNTRLNQNLLNLLDKTVKRKNKEQLTFKKSFLNPPLGTREFDSLEHLFQEACSYLTRQKRHLMFLYKNEIEKKEEFRKFLGAWRFNINRESIEELQNYSQKLIQSKYPNCSPLLYAHIRLEIENWFTHPRQFVANHGEDTPIIDSQWMEKILGQADLFGQAIEKLFQYSIRQFDQVQTTIQKSHVERQTLLEEIDNKISPASVLLITGPKGIGKSALIKVYLESRLCPWFAFKGEDLNEYLSWEDFLHHHGLSLDKGVLQRFDQKEKKILYVDSIEKIQKNTRAFFDLIQLFRVNKWTIILSSTKRPEDLTNWLREDVGISEGVINEVTVPPFGHENQGAEDHFLLPFLDKYPILSHIRWNHLFQPYYNDLFNHPLYLKFFCEETEKLYNLPQYFDCDVVLENFEQKIWKKVIRNDNFYSSSEGAIPELRQRLMINLAIAQVLGKSNRSIVGLSDSKQLQAFQDLKRDQLLNEKGNLMNAVFRDLSLKMYFQEMIEEWLCGQGLENLSDKNLGGSDGFDRLFTHFLHTCFHKKAEFKKAEFKIDALINFLKEKHSDFEGLTACLFHYLLRMENQEQMLMMLKVIPNVANLPIFWDGSRIRFPINVAIDSLNTELMEILINYGAKLRSPEQSSQETQLIDKRPRDLGNFLYKDKSYFCCVPCREAITIIAQRPGKSADEKKRILTLLIDNGASLRDPVDFYSDIPLLYEAARQNDPHLVYFLLEQNMAPDGGSMQCNETPLGVALRNLLLYCQYNASSSPEVMQYIEDAKFIFVALVTSGAKRTSPFAQKALHTVIGQRQYSLAEFLLKNDFDPTQEDENRWTALDYALNNVRVHGEMEDINFYDLITERALLFKK